MSDSRPLVGIVMDSDSDFSDAHVLSEHASGSTGHTAVADPAGTPPESHPYGQAHRP